MAEAGERPTGPGADRFAEVAANAESVRRRLVAAGGHDVAILAVTKGFGPVEVAAARAAGLGAVGENYAQELVAKHAAAARAEPGGPLVWHFIGQLQRNKVRTLAGLVDVWQTVDRAELAAEIAKRVPGASVLVQVNVSGEAQKGGCTWDELEPLVRRARDLGLHVDGVMAIGPTGPPERARGPFTRLVERADELGLRERSIGMSADLEVAVEAGSTMVRVGRDLFGPRPRPRDD
jgi:pyridoxal phosphate enzyme (YggS family)